MAPLPPEPLTYPIFMAIADQGEDDELEEFHAPKEGGTGGKKPIDYFSELTLFTALFWLLPVFILAGWLSGKDPAVQSCITFLRNSGESTEDIKPPPEEEKKNEKNDTDVVLTQKILPLLDRFFEEKTRIVPPNAQVMRRVECFHFPTPRGVRSVSRDKVEGAERPPPPSFFKTSNPNTIAAAATAAPGLFCLWPSHNQFLLNYESKEKLQRMTYIELDRLRFAFVAVKLLIEEYQVFHPRDGSLTGLAKRDIKNNCSRDGKWSALASSASSSSRQANKPETAGAGSSTGSRTAPAVGRGGGNARLHQGSSGNVITAPSSSTLERQKETRQLRFLKEELENMCTTRWPHSPISKSCQFLVLEERKECDLTGEEKLGVPVGGANAINRSGKKRKGPTFFLCAVDLPLFNKKGGVARFRAERWWTVKADGESDAAAVAIGALRNLKT